MGLLEQAHAILTADGWSLLPSPDGAALVTTVAGDAPWMVIVAADDDAGVLTCYSVLPDPVEPARRGEVMEVLTRANYGSDTVTYEIDLDDGEVRCRSGIALGAGARITAELLRPLVGHNVAAAEQMFARLRSASG